MFRVLVLIGAILFFRAVLPRTSQRSPTAITPYMNALDGTMSPEQVSSILHEVTPYESWLASRRPLNGGSVEDEQSPPDPIEAQGRAVSAAKSGPAIDLGRQP